MCATDKLYSLLLLYTTVLFYNIELQVDLRIDWDECRNLSTR